MNNEMIAKIKEVLKDLDTSKFPEYDGEYEIPLGEVIYDPEEKVFAHRRAEEDWPYSCGFECCGVAEYAKVIIPEKVLIAVANAYGYAYGYGYGYDYGYGDGYGNGYGYAAADGYGDGYGDGGL